MLRPSLPGLAASAAAPFAVAADSLRGGFLGSKSKAKQSPFLSLKPFHRRLDAASPISTSTLTSPTSSALKALSSRDAPPPAPLDFDPSSLTGRWHKIKAESDDMKAACDAVELSKILRIGVGLVNTLEVTDERNGKDAHFATTLKAGGILDVKEKYPWSGTTVEHSRRDKRRGKHLGGVSLVEVGEGAGESGGGESGGGAGESGGGGGGGETTTTKRLHPRISVTWSDPFGGECTDTFVLSENGRKMTQLSELAVRGKKVVSYKTVFAR